DTRERAADMHVLTARGVESESELPFAGLHQLVGPAFGHFDRLPAPQAVALRGALGLQRGTAPEPLPLLARLLSLPSPTAYRCPPTPLTAAPCSASWTTCPGWTTPPPRRFCSSRDVSMPRESSCFSARVTATSGGSTTPAFLRSPSRDSIASPPRPFWCVE